MITIKDITTVAKKKGFKLSPFMVVRFNTTGYVNIHHNYVKIVRKRISNALSDIYVVNIKWSLNGDFTIKDSKKLSELTNDVVELAEMLEKVIPAENVEPLKELYERYPILKDGSGYDVYFAIIKDIMADVDIDDIRNYCDAVLNFTMMTNKGCSSSKEAYDITVGNVMYFASHENDETANKCDKFFKENKLNYQF